MLVRVVVVLGVVLAQGEEQVNMTRGGDVSVSSPEGSCKRSCIEFSSYLVEDRTCVNDTTIQLSETITIAIAI